MKALALILLGTLGLAGCAQLSVRVDVLSPDYLQAALHEDSFRRDAQRLAAGDFGQAQEFVRVQRALYLDFRAECLNAAARSIPDQRFAAVARNQLRAAATNPSLIRQVDDAVFWPLLERLRARDRRLQRTIRDVYAADLGDARTGRPMPAGLAAALRDREDAYLQEARGLYATKSSQDLFCRETIRSMKFRVDRAPPTEGERERNAEVERQAVERAKRVITGGGILLASHLEAFHVVNAPDDVWAEHYNRALGYGFGGGTDIAIKLNETADFSVKGFSFDGRATAEMVRKVATQTVTTIAAAYGAGGMLPKAPKAGGDAAGAGTTELESVLTMRQRKAASDLQSSAFRSGLFRVADSILANPGALVQGDTPAVTAVTAAVASSRTGWRPQLASGSGGGAGTPPPQAPQEPAPSPAPPVVDPPAASDPAQPPEAPTPPPAEEAAEAPQADTPEEGEPEPSPLSDPAPT